MNLNNNQTECNEEGEIKLTYDPVEQRFYSDACPKPSPDGDYLQWDVFKLEADNSRSPLSGFYFYLCPDDSKPVPGQELIGHHYLTGNSLKGARSFVLYTPARCYADLADASVRVCFRSVPDAFTASDASDTCGNDYRKPLLLPGAGLLSSAPADPVPDYADDQVRANSGYIAGTSLNSPIPGSVPGAIAWDIPSYAFLADLTPGECNTIHPNLLRQEQLNNINGLFLVRMNKDGNPENGSVREKESRNGTIYQLRSFDIATMTFVRSARGWIVIDPLSGEENVSAGLSHFRNLFPPEENPIVAVIVTHSHVDHYRGIMGLVEDGRPFAEAFSLPGSHYIGAPENDNDGIALERLIPEDNRILYIAPVGFYDEAISENLYLGNSMTRRSSYMYGRTLPHDARGHIGSGLGKTVGDATGALYRPSVEIDFPDSDVRTFVLDGVTISFLDAHDSEAPSEFHIYFHDYKTLCPGENITHTMHNLLTCRGAKIRNPKAFARAIDRSLQEWGAELQVIVGTHHWPTWGNAACTDMMRKQRDMYLYFNDQVIHRINRGMNMEEIAEDFRLPASLASECYNRGYYGSLNHNVKAVFQYYVGWWDGNPANYYKYPEAEAALRFVDCMGGCEEILRKARQYFDAGDYRWTIELTKQLVFCPGIDRDEALYRQARYLQADAMEQLAYGFEAGTWRNIFLTGARELRGGTPPSLPMSKRIGNSAAQIANLPPEQAFEYMSILVGSAAAEVEPMEVWLCIGSTLYYRLYLENGVLHYEQKQESSLSEEEKGKCLSCDDMEEFSTVYKEAMEITHPDNIPADKTPDNTAPLVMKGTSPNASLLIPLCTYLELPAENWNIVYPL